MMNTFQVKSIYRMGKLHRLLSGEPGYFLSFLPNSNAVWYRVAKVGTRSIDSMLSERYSEYYYGGYECAVQEQAIKGMFRFGFVRNPVDRLISLHANKVINGNDLGFSESTRDELRNFDAFLDWIEDHDLATCDQHWRLQTKLLDVERMDFIGRFESFERDWADLVHKLDLDVPLLPIHKNRSHGKWSALNPAQLKRIQRLYQADLDAFYPDDWVD